MLFTEGKNRNYERMMQEKPRFHRSKGVSFPNHRQRDCPHCLYYDEAIKKCGLEKCIVFQE